MLHLWKRNPIKRKDIIQYGSPSINNKRDGTDNDNEQEKDLIVLYEKVGNKTEEETIDPSEDDTLVSVEIGQEHIENRKSGPWA